MVLRPDSKCSRELPSDPQPRLARSAGGSGDAIAAAGYRPAAVKSEGMPLHRPRGLLPRIRQAFRYRPRRCCRLRKRPASGSHHAAARRPVSAVAAAPLVIAATAPTRRSLFWPRTKAEEAAAGRRAAFAGGTPVTRKAPHRYSGDKSPHVCISGLGGAQRGGGEGAEERSGERGSED